MPRSTRVDIPSTLAEAATLHAMCAAADQLKLKDTPQALPILGVLDKRAPSRFGVLMGFFIGGCFLLAVFVLLLLVAAVLAVLLFDAYRWLLGPIAVEQSRWLIVWGVIAALVFVWLVVRNAKVHDILRCDTDPADVRLAAFWRGLLWLARQFTRLAMLSMWLVSLAGLLLPVLYGVHQAWVLLQGFEPIRLGPIQPLQQYLGMEQYVSIGPLLILIAAGVIGVLLAYWAPWLLLGVFWAFGLWVLFQPVGFDQFWFAVVVGLAALWPLHIPYFGARLLRWIYRRCNTMIERLVLGWALRDSLAAAFAEHRSRNSKQVAKNGKLAVCKRDLAFFVEQRSGPVSYWWCPECEDDDSAYTGVRLVRGVLDLAQTDDFTQQGDALLVNLRAWQDGAGIRPAPPLQEVYIGKLADPHEVEMFITQYHSVQAERKWPSLSKVTAGIALDSNLDENARRQVQRNLRVV